MHRFVNRRQLLRLSAAFASAPAILPATARSAEPHGVIFMVSDGMSAGVIPLAEAFSQVVRGRGTVWHDLLQREHVTRGFFDMASLNSMVTDSSAASSSWGSGARIFNAMLNVLPDGTHLTPIGWLAHDKGRKVGLVTTATVTHATPAGFAAVSPRRDDEDLIAAQYLGKVDVVLGGGRKFFLASKRKDRRDLAADCRSMGYQVSLQRKDLKAAPWQKLLGLYDDSHVPYTIDQRADPKLREDVPTLAEMTRAALTALDSAPNGFLLQVEGARVDHAAHANDAAAQLWDQLAFDDAIRAVLDHVQRHPDTLVLITSDHGNSNPGLFGMGDEYRMSTQAFELLAKSHCSYAIAAQHLGAAVEYAGLHAEALAGSRRPSADFVREAVRGDFGIELDATEAGILAQAIGHEKRLSANRQLDNVAGILGQVLGNHTGIGWIGTTHSADYTISTALGPGSPQFAGLVRNTDVFVKLSDLMGIRFQNPSMDPERARRFSACVPRRQRPDWA